MAIDFSKYGTPIKKKPIENIVTTKQEEVLNTPMVTKLPLKEEKFFGGKTGQEFMNQSKAQQITQAFVATLPKDVYDFAIKSPLDFAKSIAEAIPTIATGGKTTPDFGGYVSEAKKATEQNKGIVESLAIPAVKTIGSGLEVYGMAKMINAYGKMRLGQKSLNQTSSSLSNLEKKTASARTLTGSKLTGVKEVPGNYSKQVAKIAEPYIDNNIVKTENNLKQGISKIASKLSADIEKTSQPLNWKAKKALLDEIDNINPTILTKADPVKNKVFNEFKDRILSIIGSAKNDSELFNIRKGIDELATLESGGKMWEESGRLNPIYELWRQGRKSINNFVGNRIPGTVESLKTQSLLYDALEGVSEKTGKLLQKPGLIKKVVKSGLRWGTSLGIGGAGAYGVSKVIGKQ